MASAALLIERSPRVRGAIRAIARLANPFVLQIAGRRWMPIVGVVHHVGRHTGRPYSTPLGMRRLGDSLVIPRTFGAGAAWYRNLVAAGGADATYGGLRRHVGSPQERDLAAVAPAFPHYERTLFRLLGINDFVVVPLTA